MSDPIPDPPASPPRLQTPPADDIIFFQVRDALQRGGCPVCRIGRVTGQRYLTAFLHEQVNDPFTRARVLASRGFCGRHAWMLIRYHDVLGVAIVYRHLLQALDADLHRAAEMPDGRSRSLRSWAARIRAAIRPKRLCPACESVHAEEESALVGLMRRLADPEVAGALRGSTALCLPHLLRGLELAPDPPAARWLIELHRDRYKQLIADLSELIRKHDYRFSKEGVTEEEGAAWQRAIAALVGEDPLQDRARQHPHREPP